MSSVSNKENNDANITVEVKSPSIGETKKSSKKEAPTEEEIRLLNEAALTCSIENKEACMMCSS
jgi:hypothetical protein